MIACSQCNVRFPVYRALDHLEDAHRAPSQPRARFECGQCTADAKTLDELAGHCIQTGHQPTGATRARDTEDWIRCMLRMLEHVVMAGKEFSIVKTDEVVGDANEDDDESISFVNVAPDHRVTVADQGEMRKADSANSAVKLEPKTSDIDVETTSLCSNDDYQEYLKEETDDQDYQDYQQENVNETLEISGDKHPGDQQSFNTNPNSAPPSATAAKKAKRTSTTPSCSTNNKKAAVIPLLPTPPPEEVLELVQKVQKERPKETEKDHNLQRDPETLLYHCADCPVRLKKANDFIRHRRIHTGEKPFPCPICGVQFRQKVSRSEHIVNQHTKAYRFRCDGCGKGFSRVKLLLAHMKKAATGNHGGSSSLAKQTCRRRGTSSSSGKQRNEADKESDISSADADLSILSIPPPATLADWNKPWRKLVA